jgi:hypothetical protein
MIKRRLLKLKGIEKCEECGYEHALDFHHVEEKSFDLALVVARKISPPLEIIVTELDKCSVLCSNCHAMKHIDIKRFERLKPLIDHKLQTHKEYNKPIDKETVRKLLSQGVSKAKTARLMGCAKSTITRISKGG